MSLLATFSVPFILTFPNWSTIKLELILRLPFLILTVPSVSTVKMLAILKLPRLIFTLPVSSTVKFPLPIFILPPFKLLPVYC